jgi:hypothetical protein
VTIIVALRIYTRTVIKRSMGYDDYSIIIGFIFTAGLVAAVILANERFFWYGLCLLKNLPQYLRFSGNDTSMMSQYPRYLVSFSLWLSMTQCIDTF